ncbi:MAG: hypothetical protein PF638_01990 [Candidatus Delongbacteria bacterium]|jgi:hypothetical protein|nr:hypothetical protein [Candidatus Delongbacteria bacterium]
MKLFVIHRFKERKIAKTLLQKSGKLLNAKFELIFLDSKKDDKWKEKAIDAISKVEAVIIFNASSCEESENAKWEINKVKENSIPIVEVNSDNTPEDVCLRIKPLYNLEKEFLECFNSDKQTNLLEQYKLMINSSENLIQRRLKTNAFFITTIGSILTIAGLLFKSNVLKGNTFWLLYVFSIVGVLLCNSWRNLIDNYGKLNKAKFGVILQIEKQLSAQIYQAEWVSLGKGLRPDKYKSFTSTEKNVPFYFALLIILLTLIAIIWQIYNWSNFQLVY